MIYFRKILDQGHFDLHIHTTASDGIYTPAEIVHKAKEAGLKTIAITDHDTLAGVLEAVREGERLGIEVIAGVELSTKYQGKSVDILGYGIVDIDTLDQSLMKFRSFRNERALQILKKFADLGMPISIEEVQEFSKGELIARPHIAQAIVKKGYLPDMQTVFDHYLGDGKPCAVDKISLSPEEGIQMIHQHGGIAVLAHPALIQDDSLVRKLLQKHDFDGIEVWHRKHNVADRKRYRHLADEYGLLKTGGSDFHHDEHKLGQFGF